MKDFSHCILLAAQLTILLEYNWIKENVLTICIHLIYTVFFRISFCILVRHHMYSCKHQVTSLSQNTSTIRLYSEKIIRQWHRRGNEPAIDRVKDRNTFMEVQWAAECWERHKSMTHSDACAVLCAAFPSLLLLSFTSFTLVSLLWLDDSVGTSSSPLWIQIISQRCYI